MEIPEDEWQRANPGCERYRCSVAKQFISRVQPATRTAQQASRQERIDCHPTLQKSEERIGKQHDRAHNREGQLKACGKKLVCIPAEKNERRCCEAVEYKSFSFEKETANHNRGHHCCPDAGNVQSCHCSVKKKQRNDERRCGPARKPRHRRQHPQKRGDDSHVQASDSEEVKRACLLKWFFDVLRRL